MKKTGGKLVVECLLNQGVDVLFGMPGTHTAEIYDALYDEQSRIRHILVRNEQNASLMAIGYAGASGKPGVCLTIPGPGASHAASGIAEAYASSAPILLITGQEPAPLLRKDFSKLFHGLDHQRVFQPITKWVGSARSPDDIPQLMAEAFRQMLNDRPGPVLLEFRRDVLEASCNIAIPEVIRREPRKAPRQDIERAAELIRNAKKPLIIAGDGVLHSSGEQSLTRFCETLNAPVATLQSARGVISDDHPLAAGDIRGRPAQNALQAADLAIGVGCKFSYFDTQAFAMRLPCKLIHIDSDEREPGSDYPAEVKIIGCSAVVLEQILEALDPLGAQGKVQWNEALPRIHGHRNGPSEYPMIGVLRKTLPRNAVVVLDVHMTAYRMRTEFPIYHPRSYLASGCYVTLGYALPVALGAKACLPDREVVVIAGDGGFLTSCQELATAAQFGLKIIVVIVNDNCFTSIKHVQDKRYGGRHIGVHLQNPDFVGLVRSFGLHANRATDMAQLERSLKVALKQDVTTVIEFPAATHASAS